MIGVGVFNLHHDVGVYEVRSDHIWAKRSVSILDAWKEGKKEEREGASKTVDFGDL